MMLQHDSFQKTEVQFFVFIIILLTLETWRAHIAEVNYFFVPLFSFSLF